MGLYCGESLVKLTALEIADRRRNRDLHIFGGFSKMRSPEEQIRCKVGGKVKDCRL